MNQKEILPVITVTGILLVYCVLVFTQSAIRLSYTIFVASPFLMIRMAYSVIRKGKYAGKELEEDEEWGYADKKKDELKLF